MDNNRPKAYTEQKSIGTHHLDSHLTGKSSGQQVLLPVTTQRNRVSRAITICVNSRERNVVINPNPNLFRWKLKRNLKNIQSFRLIGGTLPGDLYNINTGWNKFTFLENNIKYTISLNPGKYDGSSIATELERALNASGLANTYDVLFSTITNKLNINRISGTYNFSFLFGTGNYLDKFEDYTGTVETITNDYLSSIGCPARMLGFVSIDYSDTSGIITAPYPVDIGWFLNKVYLHINVNTSLELNRIELSQASHDPYTIIFLDDIKNGIKFLNKETDYPELLISPAPLARLSLLEISLRDEFYNLLDIQNKEYILLFEVVYLE
jgi:hypothetical protein